MRRKDMRKGKLSMRKKKLKFKLGAEIRAIARERVGQPKPRKVILSKKKKAALEKKLWKVIDEMGFFD